MSRRDQTHEGVDGELTQDTRIGDRSLTTWHSRLGRSLAQFVHWLSDRLGPNGALILTLAFGALLVVALSVAAAQVYDNVTDADGVAGLDKPLLEFVMTLRSSFLSAIVVGYTEIAGPIGMPVIAVATLLILGIHRRSWTPVILVVAAGGGSLLMTIAGKDLIGRARPALTDAVPPFEYSPSFPSGHTLNAVAVVGIIAYLLILRQKTIRARVLTVGAAVLFAITIGLTRVYLGHHWFTDVLAGWLLGTAWLAMVITSHRLYLTVRTRRHERRRTQPPAVV